MKKLFAILLVLSISFFNSVFAEENTDNNLKTIIENGYEFSTKGLSSAVAYGDVKTVEAFLKLGYKPDTKVVKIPLTFYAVMNEKEKVLDELLTAGANPNETWGKVSLLTSSIEKKNTELVKILIKHQVNVNSTSFKITPLNYALVKKETEIAKILLKAGATPDKKSVSLVKKLKDEQLKNEIINDKNIK